MSRLFVLAWIESRDCLMHEDCLHSMSMYPRCCFFLPPLGCQMSSKSLRNITRSQDLKHISPILLSRSYEQSTVECLPIKCWAQARLTWKSFNKAQAGLPNSTLSMKVKVSWTNTFYRSECCLNRYFLCALRESLESRGRSYLHILATSMGTSNAFCI